MTNGPEIVVLSKQENDQTEYLHSLGITVMIRQSLSHCCAILDKSAVWYGSVNLLGFSTEEDNMIRLTDTALAAELIEALI